MSNLLRSLALVFLVLGAVAAADAAATGQNALQAAACFVLEFVFLWLARQCSAVPTAGRSATPASIVSASAQRSPEHLNP